MVCLRWRPYLLAAVAAAATERVSGPALGVVLYAGNGSSAAVKVAAALTAQYFPPHAEVRHYLCTDARSAAAVRDSLGNGTVLTFPDVDQDAKFLHCVQRVREPAVLLVMDDWWLIAPVDADVLVTAAQVVGSPSGPRISSVRPVCWDREQLAFGGVTTPWPGVFIQFDLPLQPTIWRRDVLAELLKRTIAWVPAHSRHCAQRNTCPRERTRARQGRQRVEGFSRAAYSWRQLWRQGFHDTTYPDDSSASLVYSGAPHCPAQRRSPQNFAGYDWIHALQHGRYLMDKRVGAQFCAMSRTARVHLRSLLVELDYASRHHYFASESACDAAVSTPMPPPPPRRRFLPARRAARRRTLTRATASRRPGRSRRAASPGRWNSMRRPSGATSPLRSIPTQSAAGTLNPRATCTRGGSTRHGRRMSPASALG